VNTKDIDQEVWSKAKALARLKGIPVAKLIEKILIKYLDESGLNLVTQKLEELNHG